MNKEELLKFLRQESKQLNICFYCNDFDFADRLLNFFDSSHPNETQKVSTNKANGNICGIESCKEPSYKYGLCREHYADYMRM